MKTNQCDAQTAAVTNARTNDIEKAFLCGIFFALSCYGMFQDWQGNVVYLKWVEQHWSDTHWLLWALIAVITFAEFHYLKRKA